jgi:hypothetical protein
VGFEIGVWIGVGVSVAAPPGIGSVTFELPGPLLLPTPGSLFVVGIDVRVAAVEDTSTGPSRKGVTEVSLTSVGVAVGIPSLLELNDEAGSVKPACWAHVARSSPCCFVSVTEPPELQRLGLT